MKKANQNTKSAIKKIADRIVIKESREWPPGSYAPERKACRTTHGRKMRLSRSKDEIMKILRATNRPISENEIVQKIGFPLDIELIRRIVLEDLMTQGLIEEVGIYSSFSGKRIVQDSLYVPAISSIPMFDTIS